MFQTIALYTNAFLLKRRYEEEVTSFTILLILIAISLVDTRQQQCIMYQQNCNHVRSPELSYQYHQ